MRQEEPAGLAYLAHRLSKPAKRVGAVRDGHQAVVAAGIPKAGDESVAVRFRDDQRRVAHRRGFPRQRAVHVELLTAKLDDAGRARLKKAKSCRRWQAAVAQTPTHRSPEDSMEEKEMKA